MEDRKSKVILLQCETYDVQDIYEKIQKGMKLLGGVKNFVSEEERILLKPNLVRGAEVERAVITHPAVMEALARCFFEAGCKRLSCGDSCGVGNARKIMHDSGMEQNLKAYGVEMVDFSQPERVTYRQGGGESAFMMAKEVLKSDALISVSKMKTHALEHVTGAVKNQYGCISGFHKAKGHTLYPDADSFARMLVHLNQYIQPRLYVCDCITAMEGNGPTSGDPVHMGVILMSADPVALDSLFCRLIHLNPELVPTNVHGQKMGLGVFGKEELEILTLDGIISVEEAVERYGKKQFRVDRSRSRGRGLLGKIGFLKAFKKKPYIEAEKCVACGVCVESCPVEGKALGFSKGRKKPPVYDYRKCIRCFCCQEMCPHKAIKVRK